MAETRTVARLAKYTDFTSPTNAKGLGIKVQVKGKTAFSDVTIPQHMAGWQGPTEAYAHKGAIATIVDTVMAFGGIHLLKRATNTKSLTVEYYTQVPVGAKLRAEARLVQKRGDTEAVLECELRDAKGTVVAKGTGTYATYSPAQLRDLTSLGNPELVLAPSADTAKLANLAACRPADLAAFEKMLSAL